MADARLRSEWLGQMRFDDLSDAAWRVFTSALMWSVGNGTDGVIPKRHMRYLHPEGVRKPVTVELVKAGLWSEQGESFVLVDWSGAMGQSTADQIEKYRDDARERQRRRRERAKQRREGQETERANSPSQDGSVTENVTRDVTANVGTGIGTGLGTGEGYEYGDSGEQANAHTGEVVDWPTVVPGSGAWSSPDAPGNVVGRRAS